MDLIGCGCMGFSFTKKYKNAIISFYDVISEMEEQDFISYPDLQSHIAMKGVSEPSEVRMYIPFLMKAKVINPLNCIKNSTGSRIKGFKINDDFFTEQGTEFIKILKLDMNKDLQTDEEVIKKIESLYHKAGMRLVLALTESEDYIYKEIILFLKKYKTIDKNEFYILTTCIEKSYTDKLEKIIKDYRDNKIGEIHIVQNVNDWQYLTGTLDQLGIIEQDENKNYILTRDALSLEVKENE